MATQNLNESLKDAILQIYNEFHPTTGVPLTVEANATLPDTLLQGKATFTLTFSNTGQYNTLSFKFEYNNYGYTNSETETTESSSKTETTEPSIWEPGEITPIYEITPNTHGNYTNVNELKNHCFIMNKVSGFIYNKFEIIIGTIETILQNYLPESSS